MNVFRKYNCKAPTNTGFTLLETVVGIGVFSVLMLMGTVALFTTIHAQRKTAASQQLIQNLDFAVDSMIRTIRTGTDYYCGVEGSPATYAVPTSCTSGILNTGVLAIEGYLGDEGNNNDQIVFKFEDGQIMKSTQGGGTGTFVALTSETVNITQLYFRVYGAEAGDNLQPRVFILIDGTVGTGSNLETPFTIQTTVSQRRFDS